MPRIVVVLLGLVGSALTLQAAEPERSLRYMLHGGWNHEVPSEEYLQFVERVKPDLVILGVFDQRLYAATVAGTNVKAKGPPPTAAEVLAQWQAVAERLHRSGIRLVGQMELFVVSDQPAEREKGLGWFGYYDQGWDEKLLGRRPTRTADELLEEPDLDGPKAGPDVLARCGCRVNAKALRGCANKPGWRTVQKAMVQAAVDIGVDGFITNRNYFEHCACEHCTARFRRWLSDHFTAEQLRERFGIADLAKAPLCVVGNHREHETVPPPLVLEKQRFAKHMVKEFFDEVYTDFGRSRRPDLLLCQWNHMAYFDELHLDKGHLPASTRTSFAHVAADERWGLPLDLWGKGESFFWYCNWGTTQNTILEKEYAGDTVLYGKLLRALARGRPYVINKYDFYRPRNMMAEAAALGYLTNAIATPWQTDEDRATVVRYFDFLKKHEPLYLRTQSLAEVALVFPRRAIQAADAVPVEYVEAAGRTLIQRHVLFDIIPDDLLSRTDLPPYQAVILAGAEYLDEGEKTALARYAERGGKVLLLPETSADRDRAGAVSPEARRQAARHGTLPFRVRRVENARTDRDGFAAALSESVGGEKNLSRFAAPWSVQIHAYYQPEARRVVVHLVNYNHQEKAAGKSVVAREAPIAAEPVSVRLRLPDGFKCRSLKFLSPDGEGTTNVEFKQAGATVEYRTPGFLVYGVCVIEG